MNRSPSLKAIFDLFVYHVDNLAVLRGARSGCGASANRSLRDRLRSDTCLGRFSVWVSEPWREELEVALGPVMGWVIPIFLAYIPGLVIGFMIFTLLITRYQELPLGSQGRLARRRVPSLTVQSDSVAS